MASWRAIDSGCGEPGLHVADAAQTSARRWAQPYGKVWDPANGPAALLLPAVVCAKFDDGRSKHRVVR